MAKRKNLFFLLLIILIAIFVFKKVELNIPTITASQQNQTKINNDFTLSIKKLNVHAPVLVGVDATNKEKYNVELTKGVAHMVGMALPGEKGNVFIYGHSSSDIKSPYDKIFAKLNDLQNGDEIVVNYKNKIYTYYVMQKKIVEKNDLSVIEQSDEKLISLMTCWPIGTTDKRLIVIAK